MTPGPQRPAAARARPFALDDLPALEVFGARLALEDSGVEPFSPRLRALATSPRALLQLWRVAHDAHGVVVGLAFALSGAGQAARGSAHAEIYGAVAPAARRQGLAAALLAPALAWARAEGATLRARSAGATGVPSGAAAARFLLRQGFARGPDILHLLGPAPPAPRPLPPGVRVLEAKPRDRAAWARLESLAQQAYQGAPDAYDSLPGELEAAARTPGGLLWTAHFERETVGVLGGTLHGGTLAVGELAVLPRHRRRGVAGALLHAAAQAKGARQLWIAVHAENLAALAAYRNLGLSPSGSLKTWTWPAAVRLAVEGSSG